MPVVDKYIIDVKTQGTKKAQSGLKGVDTATKKLIGTLGGVVGGLATARFAFNQFSDAVKLAGEFEGVSAGFENLTAKAGFSANTLDLLTDALDGTANKIDIMKQANSAMLLGIFDSEEQMATMFDTAQRLGRALGIDTTQAIESLTTGLGRQSKLMLDNLGIVFDVEDAYNEYAEILGVTAENLTDAEKKQAFTNKTISEAERLVSGLGDESLTMRDSFSQLTSSIDNFKISFADAFSEDIISIINTIVGKMDEYARANEKPVDSMIRTGDLLASQKDKFLELTKGIELFQNMVDNPYGDTFYDTISRMAKKEGVEFEEMLDIMETSLFKMESEMDGLFETAKKYREEQGKGVESTKSQSASNEELSQGIITTNEGYINYVTSLIEANEQTKLTEEFNQKLIEQYPELATQLGLISAQAKVSATSVMTSTASMLNAIARGSKEFAGGAKIAGRLQQASAIINAYSTINKIMADPKLPFPTNVISATAVGASAFANVMSISKQLGEFEKAEQGGLIGGRRHSQGGTIIEAERGEFVINRRAVNSLGLEQLNRLNQGQQVSNIEVNINGGMIDQNFVENELAESIREAVRRGSDFGIS